MAESCFLIAQGACYVPSKASPAECHRKRKKYLDQKKLVRAGAPCLVVPCSFFVCYSICVDISCGLVKLCPVLGPVGACSAALGCGHFNQDYIDALKGWFGSALGSYLLISRTV